MKLSLWLWLCLMGSSVALREHFCKRNMSVSSMVPVNKQPSKWMFWKKVQEIIKTYATHEEQISYKVILECCPGYLQVATGLCEPICERGCPTFASCVAPQRCQCNAGYVSATSQRDNSHYCEPVCDSFCSDVSECVGPNTCACKEGYNAAQPVGDAVSVPCLPSCRLNNGCENGKCDEAADICVCNEAYTWSTILHACIQTHFRPITEGQSVEQQEMTTIREQGIEEPSKPIVCEKGLLLYAGQCRAAFVESNELQVKHCRHTGCGAHQTCDEATGNCTCNIGYSKDEPKEGVTTLTCHRSILGDKLRIDEAVDDEYGFNFFIILGFSSGFLFVLIVAGLTTRIRRGRHGGSQEVLQGEFSQKTYDVIELVP
ncbi:hypothetical protein KR215_006703 [Drosophila sulfurigaster]|nr:hypothetical protein KR215_006703 [Drosophila sulfurigaster]